MHENDLNKIAYVQELIALIEKNWYVFETTDRAISLLNADSIKVIQAEINSVIKSLQKD